MRDDAADHANANGTEAAGSRPADALAGKTFLFVAGAARSGTTALAKALCQSPAIALGMERYIVRLQREHRLLPELFLPERFATVEKGDTFYDRLDFFKVNPPYLEKFPQAQYIGDKIPRLYAYYDMLFETFPGCRVVFILRNLFDVASSFERRARNEQDTWPSDRDAMRAITEWNASVVQTANRLNNDGILVVSYEDLFKRGIGWSRLSRFLGTPIEPPPSRKTPRRPLEDVLSNEVKEAILLHGRMQRYRSLVEAVRSGYVASDDDGRAGALLEQIASKPGAG